MTLFELSGASEPRLWTPALSDEGLRRSTGHDMIRSAARMGVQLMPWQKFVLVHGGELRANGRPRFRVVLVLVARQNGKTTVGEVVALHTLMSGSDQLVLGTSTNLETAKESWQHAVDRAKVHLAHMAPKERRGALDISLTLEANRSRYKVAAASRKGGRGFSVDVGLADELREHLNWEAWDALSGATTARPNSQIWALSNQGDDRAVVLNALRDTALAYIETGEGNDSIGLFEWSARDDCDIDDPVETAQANPALGTTITWDTLASKRATHPASSYRTEYMTQRVPTLDAAVDIQAWREMADRGPLLEQYKDRVVLCLDMSWDGHHLTLVAAAVDESGRVRAEVVDAWESPADARAELPGHLEKVKPQAFGWFPNGPAASLAAELKGVRNAEELKSAQQSAVCMGLAEQVSARRVLHTGDPLLLAQVQGVSRSYSGDGWTFTRKGAGHCDAVYALAGAVHLARTLRPKARPMVLVGRKPAA